MNVLKSRIASLSLFLGILCPLFIAAIPVLCISVSGESIHIPLMVVSIVILGAGLVLIPLGWVQFGRLMTLRNIIPTVERDRIYEVDAIAARLSIPRRKAVRRIRRLMKMKILRDYFFDGNLIHPTYRLGAEENEE